jgi:hypothetical protein
VGYVKTKYDIDMPRGQASAFNAQTKAGAKTTGKPARKLEHTQKSQQPAPKASADLLDAMEAMNPLDESLGVEKVKRIPVLRG